MEQRISLAGWQMARRAFDDLGATLRRVCSRNGPEILNSTRVIAPEEVELELAEIGLSGRRFEPSEYAEALGRHLRIEILFRFVDPIRDPARLRRLALDGQLADARYLKHKNLVLINLPASLPPFLLTLTALHELAHVAAGDLVEGKRLARRAPPEEEEAREEEADARARHLYMAGSLGAKNPYALDLHGVP